MGEMFMSNELIFSITPGTTCPLKGRLMKCEHKYISMNK